jgi:hypothetical protein
MRLVDADTINSLNGSRAGESLTVYAWYNGRLSYPDPLPVSDARFSWDRDRQVQSLSLTVADPDGTLAPWLLDDPLGVGGARLQVRHNVGGASPIPQGWYRITAPAPAERWRSYLIDEAGRINTDSPIPNGKKEVLISGGATIQLQAADLGILLKNDRLLAPESPKGGSPTVLSEIRRLAGVTVPVVTTAGVVDRAVPRNTIYERERLDAIQALCKSITCDYRMNGDGQLEVYSLAAQAPVATLRGGAEGMLVQVDRSQELEGLYNTFVVDGTANNDRPVRAIAEITSGPLRVDGPHGRYTTFYESNLISTELQARNYAESMRDTHLAGLTVTLRVTCLPVPHLQQGDWVNVGNPVVNGQHVTLAGMIRSIDQAWTGTTADSCTVLVECSYADVQNVIGGVDRG